MASGSSFLDTVGFIFYLMFVVGWPFILLLIIVYIRSRIRLKKESDDFVGVLVESEVVDIVKKQETKFVCVDDTAKFEFSNGKLGLSSGNNSKDDHSYADHSHTECRMYNIFIYHFVFELHNKKYTVPLKDEVLIPRGVYASVEYGLKYKDGEQILLIVDETDPYHFVVNEDR